MKIIRQNILPPKGFLAINLFGYLFCKPNAKITDIIINEYGNVVIVELNGERFAVNIEKLSKTFVAKPAEVIQVKQKKKRR